LAHCLFRTSSSSRWSAARFRRISACHSSCTSTNFRHSARTHCVAPLGGSQVCDALRACKPIHRPVAACRSLRCHRQCRLTGRLPRWQPRRRATGSRISSHGRGSTCRPRAFYRMATPRHRPRPHLRRAKIFSGSRYVRCNPTAKSAALRPTAIRSRKDR